MDPREVSFLEKENNVQKGVNENKNTRFSGDGKGEAWDLQGQQRWKTDIQPCGQSMSLAGRSPHQTFLSLEILELRTTCDKSSSSWSASVLRSKAPDGQTVTKQVRLNS